VAIAGPEPENEQELRLALAVRGGASMAVWISGAVAEVERLRRALDDPERPDPWGALARIAGYDEVSVDVLAGTSAGGLNAALLSGSIVYGIPFDAMRGMWVRLADAEAMSRPVPKLWSPRPLSVLDGDGYFRTGIERALVDNAPRGGASGPGERAELLLTGTLLDPVREPHFDGRSHPMDQLRRTARFHFHHEGRPGEPLSDFGSGKDFPETALRLAQAARTTSSLPLAFEPARVHSSPAPAPAGEPDMFGLFSEVSGDPDRGDFRVVDGGVLDNIPVTAAIGAIARASADRPTERWLLYLNPAPTEEHEPRPGPLALPVASAALRAKMGQETLRADIGALEAHNEAVERVRLHREALYAELSSAPQDRWRAVLARQAEAVRDGHAVVRAQLDARAAHELLTAPPTTDREHLLPPVVGDPLAGWSAQVRTVLAERLSAHLREAADPQRVFGDVRALLAEVRECLDWAQDVERWADSAQLQEIGGCKAALYRLQVFGEVLQAHADRYWLQGARLEPLVDTAELDDWADRVLHRRERLQHALPSPVQPLLGAVLDGVDGGGRFQRPLEEFANELWSIVESSGADAAPQDAGNVDAVAEARPVLHRLAARLAAAAPARAHFERAEQIGYALLERTEERAVVLGELAVLTAPLDVGRAPGGAINFLRVASDQQSPLPFRALGDHLRTENKVRGSDIGHLGAFLSAKWRANDWMWGRMDAATRLVDLLLDPDRLPRHNSSASEVVEGLRRIVSEPGAGELDGGDAEGVEQWRTFLGQLWDGASESVRAELDALFAQPEGEHPLARTRELLTERLQWTIAAKEIPFVASVRSGADPDHRSEPPPPAPDRLATSVRRYSVGKQRLPSLGEGRTAGIALRLGLIAHRAIRPAGGGIVGWLARWGLTAAKPLLMAVAYAVAAPLRGGLLAFLATSAVAFTEGDPCAGGSCAPSGVSSFSGGGPDPGSAVLAVLAAVCAFWFGWQVSGRIARGSLRAVGALVITGALVAGGCWLWSTGFRLGPWGVGLVALVLTAIACAAYRPLGTVAAVAVTAVAFLLAIPVGAGWVAVLAVLASALQMVLLGTADVLPPRPRPRNES
jgi:patatin-related protein